MHKIIITTVAVFISTAAAETVQDVNKNVVIRKLIKSKFVLTRQ
jgi:hypothetical protein